MPEPNSPAIVSAVMRRLAEGGAACLLFGGWAEEALGIAPPRQHGDIDLLLPAESFAALDALIAAGGSAFEVIPDKRFAHKRAFLHADVPVEVTLVRTRDGDAHTLFWGDVRFDWSPPLARSRLWEGHRLPVVTAENLRRHRAEFKSTQPWRWKDPASVLS